MRKILVLNGPNLNLLGTREPHLYGSTTLAQVQEMCEREAEELGLAIEFRQSNHEGVMIDWIHEAAGYASGIVANIAGYTRTSIAIIDAIRAVNLPLIEIHITNFHRREAYRPPSYVSHVAEGVIFGLGVHVYTLGLRGMKALLDDREKRALAEADHAKP